MPEPRMIRVRDLELDTANLRIPAQRTEIDAVRAMIAMSPNRFWALTESLVNDGYLATESILVLEMKSRNGKMVVKEGNRRIAALKIAWGYIDSSDLGMPDSIRKMVSSVSDEWKAANERVPCTVFQEDELPVVTRIIALAHGKGELAGREQWNAVAKARHQRDVMRKSEPGLDLLERYLACGRTVNGLQKERWGGDFPLTVLNEFIQKYARWFGAQNAADLADKYPSRVKYRDELESIIRDIGLKQVQFRHIRLKDNAILRKYGIGISDPHGTQVSEASSEQQSSDANLANAGKAAVGDESPLDNSSRQPTTVSSETPKQSSRGNEPRTKKRQATAVGDPRTVVRTLKQFRPRGDNRAKLVTIRDEMIALDINKTPIAFCFLLRSMFELSAKAYCDDHAGSGGPAYSKGGNDRKLVDVLRDITDHLTSNKQDLAMVKKLHGPMVELAKKDGILSVTSMNQLVHNSRFSVTATDICTVFWNVYPLLEEMNR